MEVEVGDLERGVRTTGAAGRLREEIGGGSPRRMLIRDAVEIARGKAADAALAAGRH